MLFWRVGLSSDALLNGIFGHSVNTLGDYSVQQFLQKKSEMTQYHAQ